MAIIYDSIWEQGNKLKQLTPGYHYKKKVASLVVPEGQQVTLYENQDRTGKKTLPLREGTYHHLNFYGIGSHNPGIVHVEENGLESLDLVEIGWNNEYVKGEKYPMYYSLPVGDLIAGNDFPNDKIQWLYIPFGMTVEVFDSNNLSGGSLIFSGNIEGEKERVNLWDYEFKKGEGSASWRVSSMKIRADRWVPAGISILEESIVGDKDNKVVATATLFNNSPHKATISKEISASYTEETSEDWNIGGRVCAKAGFEAETAIMGQKLTVTGELELEVSGGYGESKTTGKERSITDIASIEIEGYGNAKASLIVEEGRMEGIAVRKWRNTRNNVIITQEGKISAKRANKSQVEVSEVKK